MAKRHAMKKLENRVKRKRHPVERPAKIARRGPRYMDATIIRIGPPPLSDRMLTLPLLPPYVPDVVLCTLTGFSVLI